METAVSLKNEGNKLFKEGKYEEAKEKYTAALNYDPTNSVIYSNRSATHLKLKNYDVALSDALECIKLNPQWSKGFFRKMLALEALGRHDEVMQSACESFRLSGEGQVKRELVSRWLYAIQRIYCLPKDSIELPRGILILSKDYLQVLAYLIQSLNGERPLSLALVEQCLYCCAEQMETLLNDFGEPVLPIIKEWAKFLPYEVYPYSINPVAKLELEHQMISRSESFTCYLNKDIDPTLYPLLRPILGLVVLVVLNRTNILAECNTGHHSAELMNRALLPLFEVSILSSDDYCSMYVGRICAILDSFIGRGYKLTANEVTTVRCCCEKLQKAIESYPSSLPEYEKDKQLAERALSNAKNNILLPASSFPPTIPLGSTMSVELAERLVKQKPDEVKLYLNQHLQELEAVKFLTMGEVEELLTMSGVFHELKLTDNAVKVFRKGEQAFFQVLGHMLTSHTLMLDQCPATIAPMRQLALSEASLLKHDVLFANVVLRWKCLFKEFRSHVIRQCSGKIFKEFFQWYMKSKTSESEAEEVAVQSAVLKQMQREEEVLQEVSKSVLQDMYETSYENLQKVLHSDTVMVDFIFFAPLRENPLLDAYCVICESNKAPIVCELDYRTIRNQAAIVTQVLLSKSSISQDKLDFELACLARALFPKELLDILRAGNISHLYISPDSDIAHIPLDLLPIEIKDTDKAIPLFEKFSVSILSSLRKLLYQNPTRVNQEIQQCYLIGNPNFDLSKPVTSSLSFGKVIDFVCGYFGISSPTGPILEQLEHSIDEIDCISKDLRSHNLHVQCICDDDATLTKILAIHNPLLIHVSSHAYSTYGRSLTAFHGNFYNDLKSCAIALAGFNTFSRKQFDKLPSDCGPAQLSPLAILSMQLKNTKLVFLSICSSAAGVAPIQEAVDSLAEAFLSAGTETVIATLWPVGDKVAADISKLFYKKVTTPGVCPSEALAYAKKNVRDSTCTEETFSLCYTAFVCYGLDQPIFV